MNGVYCVSNDCSNADFAPCRIDFSMVIASTGQAFIQIEQPVQLSGNANSGYIFLCFTGAPAFFILIQERGQTSAQILHVHEDVIVESGYFACHLLILQHELFHA